MCLTLHPVGMRRHGPRASTKRVSASAPPASAKCDLGFREFLIAKLQSWSAVLCSFFQSKKETQAVLRTRNSRRDLANGSAFLDSFAEAAGRIGSAQSVRIAARTADTHEPVCSSGTWRSSQALPDIPQVLRSERQLSQALYHRCTNPRKQASSEKRIATIVSTIFIRRYCLPQLWDKPWANHFRCNIV
jgi:hypothetical protein